MAILPIIKIGHSTLRKVAQKVEIFDQELVDFANNMIETMQLNEGIGLAAPQVNILKRLFVIDYTLIDETQPVKIYVNPEILASYDQEDFEEGCLSIPGIRTSVSRPTHIEVRYHTVTGELVEEQMDGLLARVFQHELDHLNGILFVDRIPDIQRKLIEPQLKSLEGILV
jgi:peptide deformylase